ncbi:hypothetical protein ARALYDRAFT_338701 [Arabidopsis lyrata subsp. lyrata]|uniref:Uncharacterized protein n=2 Tax=Arabidopsis lyrata subsp. lyrata TaxID=81972 RepID=D7KRT4_ARALL|nr:hypothetical protein ARALYDRAFT_338701 [Arabidopsis lyrata subsp. lyrata]
MGWWWRKRNKKRTLEEERTLKRGAKLLTDLIEFGHGISNPIKFFSADEILKATNNFSDSNRVSSDWYSDFEMDWLWKKKKKKKPKSDVVSDIVSVRGAKLLKDLIEFGHGISNPIKFFSADEILKATNYFSDSNHVFLSLPFDWYSGKNENHP